jgi:hypothetical protein
MVTGIHVSSEEEKKEKKKKKKITAREKISTENRGHDSQMSD